MIIKHIPLTRPLRAMLCAFVFLAPLSSEAESRAQDETEARVAQAVELYYRDAGGAYRMLRALGVAAIPRIVEVIKDDSDKSPSGAIKRARTNPFLVDVIAEMEGEQADAALIELLLSPDAIVRGAAAVSLGQRKTDAAVPHLIKLLDDKSPYMGYTTAHPAGSDSPTPEPTLLVCDAAAHALRNITGVDPGSGIAKSKQTKAWRSWWRGKQQ